MAQALEALFADVVPGAGDEKPGRDEGFFDLGVDSLMAVQIRAQVQQLLGRELPTSLCFDYPTITSMSEFLLRELFPEDEKIQPLKAANGAPRTVPAARTTTSNGTLDGQVQELSDEQITALIEDEMKALNLE
jgi:acyl carrier protein